MLEFTVLKSTERPGLKPEITYTLFYIASLVAGSRIDRIPANMTKTDEVHKHPVRP